MYIKSFANVNFNSYVIKKQKNKNKIETKKQKQNRNKII